MARIAKPFDWTFERRIMTRTVIQPNGCWIWGGARMRNGYGQIVVAGKHWAVHRYTYDGLVGPIPEGLDLDHLCRNRACCNPAHLEPVTRGTNLARSPLVGKYNLTKTHCPAGHPYDESNTAIRNGRRTCRACDAARARRNRKGA